MVSFSFGLTKIMIADIAFWVLFGIALTVFLKIKGKSVRGLSRQGWMFLWRTQFGVKAIEKFTKHQPPAEKEFTYDFVLLQERLEPIIESYTDNPLSDNLLIENIDLTTSTVLVSHKLNRTVRGWYVVDKTADARVWRDATDTNNSVLFLALKASASVTVSIVVF